MVLSIPFNERPLGIYLLKLNFVYWLTSMTEIITNWGTTSHLCKRVLEMTSKEFKHVLVPFERGLRKWDIDLDWLLVGILKYLKNSYLDCKKNGIRLNLALGKKAEVTHVSPDKRFDHFWSFGQCSCFLFALRPYYRGGYLFLDSSWSQSCLIWCWYFVTLCSSGKHHWLAVNAKPASTC